MTKTVFAARKAQAKRLWELVIADTDTEVCVLPVIIVGAATAVRDTSHVSCHHKQAVTNWKLPFVPLKRTAHHDNDGAHTAANAEAASESNQRP